MLAVRAYLLGLLVLFGLLGGRRLGTVYRRCLLVGCTLGVCPGIFAFTINPIVVVVVVVVVLGLFASCLRGPLHHTVGQRNITTRSVMYGVHWTNTIVLILASLYKHAIQPIEKYDTPRETPLVGHLTFESVDATSAIGEKGTVRKRSKVGTDTLRCRVIHGWLIESARCNSLVRCECERERGRTHQG